MKPEKGWYDGDEWRSKESEFLNDPPDVPIMKPFDRALWLMEEMGFVFVYHLSAFVNFDLEKKHGNPDNPIYPIDMEMMEAKVTTAVFQRAIKIHVKRARKRS